MAKNYKEYKYFEKRPDIVKIFDDLDKLLDFCRIEMLPYNPADLYRKDSRVWQSYERSQRPKRHWNNNNNGNYDRKPRDFNRGGNNYRHNRV